MKSDLYIDHIKKVIDAAVRLDLGIINTFIGADPARHDDDNFEKFREVMASHSAICRAKEY